MSGWGYRVVERDGMLTVHEVIRERGTAPRPRVRCAAPQGHTLTELRQDLERMLAALSQPVIDFEDAYPAGVPRQLAR